MRLFSDVWSENDALFERLMEIHSNPPILYYGFNCGECSYTFRIMKLLWLVPYLGPYSESKKKNGDVDNVFLAEYYCFLNANECTSLVYKEEKTATIC